MISAIASLVASSSARPPLSTTTLAAGKWKYRYWDNSYIIALHVSTIFSFARRWGFSVITYIEVAVWGIWFKNARQASNPYPGNVLSLHLYWIATWGISARFCAEWRNWALQIWDADMLANVMFLLFISCERFSKAGYKMLCANWPFPSWETSAELLSAHNYPHMYTWSIINALSHSIKNIPADILYATYHGIERCKNTPFERCWPMKGKQRVGCISHGQSKSICSPND